jgi:RimJ/RimL family protein N-acetyltransferase
MSSADEPILRDVPEQIDTERLLIRPPRLGDGAAVNVAIRESFNELQPWMSWAREIPSVEQSEIFARESAARFARREELPLLLFERSSGELLGASGLHRIDWSVPAFEVGYWCRTSCTGRGYISEAVRGICKMAFTSLSARRFEVRMDDTNERSWRIAERLGFTLEGILRQDTRAPSGELRDTRVYSILALAELR